jgi:hypothetical protein
LGKKDQAVFSVHGFCFRKIDSLFHQSRLAGSSFALDPEEAMMSRVRYGIPPLFVL